MTTSNVAQRADAFIQEWLSSEESMQQRGAGQVKLLEGPGPLVLAVNLAMVPCKSTHEQLQGATEEAIKNHKGVRVTFTVAKVLYPGWSSVGGDGDAGGGKRGGAAFKKGGGGGEPKEKLAAMDGEKVRMYSYELVNKKGVYTRGSRSGGFAVIEPGMTLSMTVWANKFGNVFKNHGNGDILPFEMVAVELGLKSSGSKSATSGMMLDIRSMRAVHDASPACPRLVRPGLMPRSRAEADAWRERFGQNPADAPEGQQQDWIAGNMSSGVLGISIVPTPAQGVFAMSESGGVTFYTAEPLADVGCRMVEVQFDRRAFGVATASGKGTVRGSDEWVVKMLNIACMMGAVELTFALDTYRTKSLNPDEVVLEGFVRVDVGAMVKNALGAKRVALESGGCEQVAKALPKEALRHTVVYTGLGGGDVDVAVDLRVLCKRGGGAVVDESDADTKGCDPGSSIAHMASAFTRAHYVHFFFKGESMLTAVACTGAGGGCASERVKRAMQPGALVFSCDDAVFEEEEPAVTEPAEKKQKKKKAAVDGVDMVVEPAAA